MRLQKYLSDIGQYSRKQAEGLIYEGKVFVNGRKAEIGETISGNEEIVIDGEKLEHREPAPKKVILFNKPKGVECVLTQNPEGKTLKDFDFGPDRVFPIGKLDVDAHGLLLLTNDGELGNRLAHPNGPHTPEYLLVTEEPITGAFLDLLNGRTDKEDVKFQAASVQQLSDTSVLFMLPKGRIKHIRKMSPSAGVRFADILRTRFGPIDLGTLAAGEWRELTPEEMALLRGDNATTLTSEKDAKALVREVAQDWIRKATAHKQKEAAGRQKRQRPRPQSSGDTKRTGSGEVRRQKSGEAKRSDRSGRQNSRTKRVSSREGTQRWPRDDAKPSSSKNAPQSVGNEAVKKPRRRIVAGRTWKVPQE